MGGPFNVGGGQDYQGMAGATDYFRGSSGFWNDGGMAKFGGVRRPGMWGNGPGMSMMGGMDQAMRGNPYPWEVGYGVEVSAGGGSYHSGV